MNPKPLPEENIKLWEEARELSDLWRKFDVPRQGLDRLRKLLSVLNNPELNLGKVIHIAGTNGKGSVLAFCRAILVAAGHKPHAFISPHLISATERIRIYDSPIASQKMIDLLHECDKSEAPVSYFECLTAAMFVAASNNPNDWTILETGLGGRLDATNLIPTPEVAIISNIGFDHQAYLGNTIASIAAEKAGIIKPSGLVVSSSQDAEAAKVIIEKAESCDARLYLGGRDWDYEILDDGSFILRSNLGEMEFPKPALHGKHQVSNAALAALSMHLCLHDKIDETAQALSFKDVINTGITSARWRGRMELMDKGPLRAKLPGAWKVWLDGAHNEMGFKAVRDFINSENHNNNQKWFAVCSFLKTKDANVLITQASRMFEGVYYIGDGEMFHGNDEVELIAAAFDNVSATDTSIDDAISSINKYIEANNIQQEINIIFIGSLHLAGELLRQNGVTPATIL